MREIQGRLDASGKRFAIVASRFNEFIVASLISGAESALVQLGARTDDIAVFRVPGALEIPGVVARLARSDAWDAIICLGAVIRGATPHFDHVASGSASGIAQVAARGEIPVVNGVLTTDTVEQAIERAGTKAGNKGADAAFGAVELIRLYEQI